MNWNKILIVVLFLALMTIFLNEAFAETPPAQRAGGVKIIIRTQGSSSNQDECGNSPESCGEWPDCLNLTEIVSCKDGKLIEFYCYSNQVKTRMKTTNCLELNVQNGDGEDEEVEIKIYRSGTLTSINSLTVSGTKNITSSSGSVDFEFSYDDSNFKFKAKNVNFEKLASKPASVTIDLVTPDIPNIIVHKAYKVELPQDFSYDSINLTMKFDPDDIENTTALSFYKCSFYDFANDQCNGNWANISSRVDIANSLVTAKITSFSAYALGEPGNGGTTTTTTTSTPTTTTSSQTTTQSPPGSGATGGSTGGSGVFISSTTSSTTATTSPTVPSSTTTTTQEEMKNKTEETVQKTTGNFVLTPEIMQLAIFASSIPIGIVSLSLMKKYNLYGGRVVRHVPRTRRYVSRTRPIRPIQTSGYMVKAPTKRKIQEGETVLQL